MAGDWIKFEIASSDKPEIWDIAGQLNIDPDAVIGKMLRIWSWFNLHTENGNAPCVTKMLLDRNVGVTGFCDAVISSGWMSEDAGNITLPNFSRHNGNTAKTRAMTAVRAATHRERGKNKPIKSNAPPVTNALPREEKRREESNKTSEKKFTDEDMKVSEFIFEKIQQLNSQHKKPNLESWADDIRLIRERDKRSHEEIKAMFTWANDDDFWKTNILSPCKLRKQWDTMVIKKNSNREKASMPRTDEEWKAKGLEYNLNPGKGELWPEFRARVSKAMSCA